MSLDRTIINAISRHYMRRQQEGAPMPQIQARLQYAPAMLLSPGFVACILTGNTDRATFWFLAAALAIAAFIGWHQSRGYLSLGMDWSPKRIAEYNEAVKHRPETEQPLRLIMLSGLWFAIPIAFFIPFMGDLSLDLLLLDYVVIGDVLGFSAVYYARCVPAVLPDRVQHVPKIALQR